MFTRTPFSKLMHSGALAVVSAALISALPATAQETSLKAYEVELVIFKVVNPTGSPEEWAAEAARAKTSLPVISDAEDPAPINGPGNAAGNATPPAAVPAPAITLATTVGSETSIQPLESGRYKLTGIEANLKRSRSYQPLAHTGWWQPGFLRESPRPVGIENLMPPGTGITGSVTLTRGTRLLHLQLDLTYQAPNGQRYVLREHRAVRSGDKHYFDHPYFGVVALVTPKG
jgi:hypothetical protein